jgi:hypothetical protein
MSDCTQAGWLWFCDVHDTHGNADSQDEAHYVSASHEEFYMLRDGEDFEGCEFAIVCVSEGVDV